MYDRSPKGSGFNPLAALAVPAMVACTLFVPQKANATLMLSADISGTLFTCVFWRLATTWFPRLSMG